MAHPVHSTVVHADVCVCVCEGRTKLEPISIVVLSVIMALASCQMILQGGTKIVEFVIYDLSHVDTANLSQVVCVSIGNLSEYAVPEGPSGPTFLTDSIVICAITIGDLLLDEFHCSFCLLWIATGLAPVAATAVSQPGASTPCKPWSK